MPNCLSPQSNIIDIFLSDNQYDIDYIAADSKINIDFVYCDDLVNIDICGEHIYTYKLVSSEVVVGPEVCCILNKYRPVDAITSNHIPLGVYSSATIYKQSDFTDVETSVGIWPEVQALATRTKEPRLSAGIKPDASIIVNRDSSLVVRSGIGVGDKITISSEVYMNKLSAGVPIHAEVTVEANVPMYLSDINDKNLQELYDKNLIDIYYKRK